MIFALISITFALSALSYVAYQFTSGNWKLYLDYDNREYDCEACDGLPPMMKRQAD